MRIFGPPSASQATVTRNAVLKRASDLFTVSLIPTLWSAAQRYNVDAVGVVAQAAYETGWGKFPGVLTAAWRNTCGLKTWDPAAFGLTGATDYERFAHQAFPSWPIGALAHVQHLVAYAGGQINDPMELVDPRYQLARDRSGAVEFADLTGRWAGSPASPYGQTIERLMADLSREP